MSRLEWDEAGKRIYETGVDKGVLYRCVNGLYPKGVAWNGLRSVDEKPTGAESTPLYANNKKYLNLRSAEDFAASIGAYTYPDEFAECDGSATIATGVTIGQQTRKPFGLAYRTLIGNDTEDTDYGYKIHLVYGATAYPTEKPHSTTNESPTALEMAWDIETTPVKISGFKPTATVDIDSTKVEKTKLKQFEDIIYGTEDKEPRLPLPDELVEIFGSSAAVASDKE